MKGYYDDIRKEGERIKRLEAENVALREALYRIRVRLGNFQEPWKKWMKSHVKPSPPQQEKRQHVGWRRWSE